MGKSNGQLCTPQLHEHVEQEEDGRRQGRCACDIHAGHPTPAVLASIQSPAWRSLPATPPPLLQLPCSARPGLQYRPPARAPLLRPPGVQDWPPERAPLLPRQGVQDRPAGRVPVRGLPRPAGRALRRGVTTNQASTPDAKEHHRNRAVSSQCVPGRFSVL
jgi:hypothetical protein